MDKENHVVTLTMQKLYIKPFLSKLKNLVSIFSSMVLFYCANVNTTFRKWQSFFLETPFPFMWQKKNVTNEDELEGVASTRY